MVPDGGQRQSDAVGDDDLHAVVPPLSAVNPVLKLGRCEGDAEWMKDNLPAVSVSGEHQVITVFRSGLHDLLGRLMNQDDFDIGLGSVLK